ncbi:MAG TPA: hypothetical protein VEZ70_01590 [Allosphingosinicella sp.]|nr:hypothetical protein [Allosphingosinicella sp.]
MRNSVNMPKWPAWILFGLAAACAYPALTSPNPTDPTLERLAAHGNEPRWQLLIDGRRIDYVGMNGKKISAERPDPNPTFNGRRYETGRLTVDVIHTRCNDDLSGRGFEHQVTVIADGKTFRGCGGDRRIDWDL